MPVLSSVEVCLDSIEHELRTLGWWEQAPPSAQALSSSEPFCVDTLTFVQWLQWIFVPRMRALLEAKAALPQRSAIADMADVVFAQQLGKTAALRRAIKQVDRLLSKATPSVH